MVLGASGSSLANARRTAVVGLSAGIGLVTALLLTMVEIRALALPRIWWPVTKNLVLIQVHTLRDFKRFSNSYRYLYFPIQIATFTITSLTNGCEREQVLSAPWRIRSSK